MHTHQTHIQYTGIYMSGFVGFEIISTLKFQLVWIKYIPFRCHMGLFMLVKY